MPNSRVILMSLLALAASLPYCRAQAGNPDALCPPSTSARLTRVEFLDPQQRSPAPPAAPHTAARIDAANVTSDVLSSEHRDTVDKVDKVDKPATKSMPARPSSGGQDGSLPVRGWRSMLPGQLQ